MCIAAKLVKLCPKLMLWTLGFFLCIEDNESSYGAVHWCLAWPMDWNLNLEKLLVNNSLSAKHVFAFTLSYVQTIKQEWNDKHRNVSLFMKGMFSGSSKPAFAQTHQRLQELMCMGCLHCKKFFWALGNLPPEYSGSKCKLREKLSQGWILSKGNSNKDSSFLASLFWQILWKY